MIKFVLIVKILACLVATVSSLSTNCFENERRKIAVPFGRNHENDSHKSPALNLMIPRRSFLVAGGASLPWIQQVASAEDAESSICIIGANGKTGSECVGACLSRGLKVVATSRGGVYTGVYNDETSKKLQTKPCDVTAPSTIESAIQGSRAVIFAASASKAGGTASAVDNAGLVNVAKACISNQIPHLVIVSSGAVTKPDSPVYKFLNVFGNIMEEKIKGEDTVRQLYNQAGSSSTCTYTVIRPGGLTMDEGKGVEALELNQGDTKSGRISRADVASLCIESTKYPKFTGGATFECYDADTAKPLQTVGISNILKQNTKTDDQAFMSGKERRGSTFLEIFRGLEKDC
mmetsp:Transcript_7575/g.11565  ORF Transcript_7575/g.11565 Transcript_7575/m.11565 type:complete len:348 (+) Transcript_7575:85-1128(+)